MLFKPFLNFPLFMPSQAPPPQINIISPQRFLYVIFIIGGKLLMEVGSTELFS